MIVLKFIKVTQHNKRVASMTADSQKTIKDKYKIKFSDFHHT